MTVVGEPVVSGPGVHRGRFDSDVALAVVAATAVVEAALGSLCASLEAPVLAEDASVSDDVAVVLSLFTACGAAL